MLNKWQSQSPWCFVFSRLQSGTKNVAFEDFTLESCRAIGILGNSVSNIMIKHMEVRNTGNG